MKVGGVINLDNRNTATSKKIDDDVIFPNCDAIVFFSIHGQFRAIPMSSFERMVGNTYIFINSNYKS